MRQNFQRISTRMKGSGCSHQGFCGGGFEAESFGFRGRTLDEKNGGQVGVWVAELP